MGLFSNTSDKTRLVTPDEALPGRRTPIETAKTHFVTGEPIKMDRAAGHDEIIVGMGCFWGAERVFWQTEGVVHTAVGYAGGVTENPGYKEVCSGRTGHAEVVRVVFDPAVISLDTILKTFWENHDPTQGMRQGNDRGTQYRSAIYTRDEAQLAAAQASQAAYAKALVQEGRGEITTEIAPSGPFYYAEADHQQYLAKNPGGYCGIGGTGVVCPIGTGARL